MGSTIVEMPSLKPMPANAAEGSIDRSESATTPERSEYKIRLANLPGLRVAASLLIRERYCQRGYDTQKLGEDAHTLTIVACESEDAIGTLSIRFDSPDGLLADLHYRREIDSLRNAGKRVCEFIKFAVNPSTVSLKIVAALFHSAFIYAYRIHGHDEIVMEVTPQHFKFYKRALGFIQLGPECRNERVGAIGVLLGCEFSYIDAQLKRFGGKLSARKKERSIYPYGFSEQEELFHASSNSSKCPDDAICQAIL